MKLTKGAGIRKDTRERKRGSMKNYFEKKLSIGNMVSMF